MEDIPELVVHLETFLGLIQSGQQSSKNDERFPFQVVHFAERPSTSHTTWVTLGLSNYVLRLPNGENIRQELCISFDSKLQNVELEMLMFVVGEDVYRSGKALLRGSVLGPKGSLFSSSPLKAFYCTFPMYFAEEFHEFELSDPHVVFVWLLPIYVAEVQYIEENGWELFEELLYETEIDLLDFERPSIV